MTNSNDINQIEIPKIGEKWYLKSNPDRFITVIEYEDNIDKEWPSWVRGYVYLSASWNKKGHAIKSLDLFFSQFIRA